MSRYTVEIYAPEDNSAPLASFSSDLPFMTLGQGDWIDPASLGIDVDFGRRALEIILIEHRLSNHGGVSGHTMLVHTRLADR